MHTPEAVLKEHFGHAAFRGRQKELVDALLEGRDVLGVMPTGAGKSVCFQVPALLVPGLTVVVSPLISLMKDQVGALTQAGIPAAYLNSALSAERPSGQSMPARTAENCVYCTYPPNDWR